MTIVITVFIFIFNRKISSTGEAHVDDIPHESGASIPKNSTAHNSKRFDKHLPRCRVSSAEFDKLMSTKGIPKNQLLYDETAILKNFKA